MATEVLPVRTRRLTLRKPLKILDPGRSKLPTVETQRIISVLDDTIFKLELVSAFSHILENLEEFGSAFGPELTGAFMEHLRLTNVMETTLARLEREDILRKGIAKGELFGAEEPSGWLAFHVQGLKSSVRNIVRLFYANPLACQAVKDATNTIPPSSSALLKSLWELREVLFEKLLTTPLEEKEKNRFMHEIAERDKKNTEMIAALEDELSAAIQNRDEEISKKNAAIKDLKTQLHNLSKFAEEHIQGTRSEGEKQQKAEFRASQAKCAKLQQELQQLRAQLDALVAENREFELFLRKKKYKVEIEIENWVQKYDIEMLEKQEEIEEIEAVYTIEKEQLAELREKFALLDQEYSQIVEERRIKQEQKAKAEKELAILSRAATLIQALWKGYLVRSQLRTRRKKKGKGKKGGRK